jgi:hypothetical protein
MSATALAQDAALALALAPAGDGASSLPALGRVPVAGRMQTGLGLAGHAGYGYTEGALGDGDAHQRLSGTLAASVRPADWLGLGLRLDGRYDSHSGVRGADDGTIGEARLFARASTSLSPALALGVETVLFVPGRTAPSLDFGATTLDVSGLLSWTASPSVALAAHVGVRLDGTGSAVPERDQLTRADRLALGASDSNALLLGFGTSWRLPSVELVAEISADLLIGADAPPVGQSPARIAAGARIPVADQLVLSLLAEVALSSRPVVDVGVPLVPVEPRLSLIAGLAWRAFGPAPAVIVESERSLDETAPPPVDPTTPVTPTVVEPTPPVTPPVVEPALPAGVIRGGVRAFRSRGGGLAGARITIEPSGQHLEADSDGQFEVEVPPGEYQVVIEADGYQTQRQRVTVEQQGVTVLNVDLRGSR